ncbi:hypothetical protein KC328_g12653 [Hortaea werneckii]|nr:hypothetical protein KC328_g12653 [Hortaea werneckii]
MWANVFSLWTNFAVIGMIYSVIAPLMLIFVSAVFMLFWIAYRHNYYYVQRNKVDTHGALFEGALSQLFAGVYVMEITLIGLFFIVRNTDGNVTATPQAVIMIVALCLTAGFHYVLEQSMRPLKEFIPVTLEDKAADAERRRFAREKGHSDENAGDDKSSTITAASSRRSSESIRRRVPEKPSYTQDPAPEGEKQAGTMAFTAASARKTMNRLHQRIGATLAATQVRSPHHGDERDGTAPTRKDDVADQLGAAIAGYPDDLVDLTPAERAAELRAAYQDPVTREPAPVVWIPQDAAGVSDDSVAQSKKYGKYLQYSNAGAFLGKSGKTEVVQPAPDVRSDWLLDWRL